MPEIHCSTLRLREPVEILGGSPRQRFRVGSEGCKSIRVNTESGIATVEVQGAPGILYVLPSGSYALAEPKQAELPGTGKRGH